jgi:GT2 family glycosyltransferase/glycosyltransferase involved in cell wall biosynthesis
MDLGISFAFINDKMGGVWTYASNLSRSMLKNEGSDKYHIISSTKSNIPSENKKNSLIYPIKNFRFSNFIWHNLILPNQLKHELLDLIHFTSPTGSLKKIRDTIYINTIYDLTPILHPETHGTIMILHYKYILPRILKRCDAIITVSENTKKDLIKYYKIPEDKIKVIYLGVDEIFKPMENIEKNRLDIRNKFNISNPYLLYVGMIEPRKNLVRLIKAYNQIKKEGYPHSLVIVGAIGWKYKEIFQLVDSLDLHKSINFTGFVELKDLVLLYNCADIFVYPSLYEGFGLPPLEAMSCGTPVVTSNTSSIPEVVGDAALLIDPYSIESIASGVKKVLDDDTLKNELKIKGTIRSKDFNWGKTALNTSKIYREIHDWYPKKKIIESNKKLFMNEAQIDLSIIIVNWNTKDFLDKCLDSIFSRKWQFSYETFVVDNNSSDGSVTMLSTKYPEVITIENTINHGFARANNQVIGMCKGRYILLLNPDTILEPNSLDKLYEFMESHENVGIVGPLMYNDTGVLKPVYKKFPSLWYIFQKLSFLDLLFNFISETTLKRLKKIYPSFFMVDDDTRIRKVPHLTGACLLARREVVEDIGYLDERYYMYFEDLDWCYRATLSGWKVVYNPKARIVHFEGQSASQNTKKIVFESYESILQFFLKYKSKSTIPFLKSIFLLGSIFRLPIWFFVLMTIKNKRREAINRIGAYWHVIKSSVNMRPNQRNNEGENPF